MFDFKKLERAGSGGFRIVFVHPDDSKKAVKICRSGFKSNHRKCLQMMRDEIKAAQIFPNLFPKVYFHTDDFEVLIVERAKVLLSNNQDKLISDYFPELRGYFIKSTESDFFEFIRRILDQIYKNTRYDTGAYDAYAYFQTSPRKVVRKALSGRLFRDIHDAIIELNIDYSDIDWGNTGLSTLDNRFLIIDASMYSGFEA